MTLARGVQGEHMTEVYLVSVGLLNGVGFPNLRVTKGILSGFEVLIGMDIITQGDLAITHHNGATCFSFRCPPSARIDFTGKAPIQDSKAPHGSPQKVGRNDPCPCKSGKKFKKYCGK